MTNKRRGFYSAASKYSLRGVSAGKEDVHKAIQNLPKGLFPTAFCHAIPHPHKTLTKDSLWFLHADGAGTKASLAYLYWCETKDVSVFEDLAQDVMVMNTDDLACVGATHSFVYSNTIARNKRLIPSSVLSALMRGIEKFRATLKDYGIEVMIAGGETADVGDIVKTLMVDGSMLSAVDKKSFIDNQFIKEGQVIVGLASFGKAIYENIYNSGIGCNGLTYARHELLHKRYRKKYPESFDSSMPKHLAYSGKHTLTENLTHTPLNIGRALLSPTRTYLPILKKIFQHHHKHIRGLIHCTGGGQTKCLHFSKNVHYVKDNLFALSPLFRMLFETSSHQKELFEVFNCGHRLEIYTEKKIAKQLIAIANDFDIEAKIIGYTEKANNTTKSTNDNDNVLTLTHENKTYLYH